MSLLLGFVIPFLIWNGFMSLVIFLHHTHPLVPWYETAAAWENDQGAIHGTAHVRFPWPADALVLSIMEHNGHHHASGVPLYHLPRMQAALAQQGDVVSWKFSLRAYARVCQRCKLYDYRGQRWVPFGQS